ncbi:MAG: Uma2 family endonuclease [Cyanobacteria bacterium J06639_1]
MLPTLTRDTIDLAPGTEIILRQQTWDDYEQLLEQRRDKAGLRIEFNGRSEEIRIMSPLPEHAKHSSSIASSIRSLLKNQELDWDEYHPLTLKCFKQQGLEPDFCFYVQNREAVLGLYRIELDVSPPPDLAVEIDVTSLTEITHYKPIGVPEVWIYRNNSLFIYLFDGSTYQESDRSLLFPDFDVKTLIPEYVDRAWTKGSSVALREFESYLRDRD